MSVAVLKNDIYGRLNPVLMTTGIKNDDRPRVIIGGGWEQNCERLESVMSAFEQEGIESVGWSFFDTVEPKSSSHPESWAYTANVGELPEEYPARMLERAQKVVHMVAYVMDTLQVDFNAVVTHCAGITPYTLALYLARFNQTPMAFVPPKKLIAVEPMIVQFESPREYASGDFRTFEKEAKTNEQLIRLKNLAHPAMPDIGTDRQYPLADIGRSCGGMLLAQTVERYDVRAVVSRRDYAAPPELVRSVVGETLTYHYPGQTRLGHGYFMAEPQLSAACIADLLRN